MPGFPPTPTSPGKAIPKDIPAAHKRAHRHHHHRRRVEDIDGQQVSGPDGADKLEWPREATYNQQVGPAGKRTRLSRCTSLLHGGLLLLYYRKLKDDVKASQRSVQWWR